MGRCRLPTSRSAWTKRRGSPRSASHHDSLRDGPRPNQLRAETLVEALPYIRRFSGKTVVVKYGGNALAGTSEHDALALFAEDVVMMRLVGLRPVVVHGGGPQISALMERLGKTTEFVDGLRVTDAETVEIARMVLKGQVNPQLVAAINVHGNYAVGRVGRRRRPDPGRGAATSASGSSAMSPRSTPQCSKVCSTTSSSR